MELVEITDQQQWDGFVAAHEWGHPLQLWGWGETKRLNDWVPYRLAMMEHGEIVAGAQVLLWQLPRLSAWVVYAPRGPVAVPGSAVSERLLNGMLEWARHNNGLYVRIEPAWAGGAPKRPWRRSRHGLQMAETFTLDLNLSEDELLEPMSRKHRQYIRKAERDGLSVRRVGPGELDAMYEIYVDTAKRAGFGLHDRDYYNMLARELGERSYIYYAEFEGRPVAFLWLAAAGSTAYELYGGVNAEGGELKANYMLKWSAIQAMKAEGYAIYDLNGRVTEGVSRFKDGFGPATTDYIGTYDYPLNKLGYQLWERLWPVAKPIGRHILKHTKRRT